MHEDELDVVVLQKKGGQVKNGNISHETVGEQAAEFVSMLYLV